MNMQSFKLQKRGRNPAENIKPYYSSGSNVAMNQSKQVARRVKKVSDKKSGIPKCLLFGMIAILLAWLLVAFYMLSSDLYTQTELQASENLGDGSSSLRHTKNHIMTDLVEKQTTSRDNKIESEVIDMRVISATLPFEDKDGGVWKQGWDVIPRTVDEKNRLKIFVVPHSHCDPGWIKTFDDYFRSQTSSIITSVVEALAKDPKRKFIWAEISYFEWWWREQNVEKQQLAKKLLQNGQLEFVTGGWVQPDEANTELYAMEVQLQEGHAWIRSNLGEKFIPKYGWSIDPFGYSPTMAYLLKKYKFEGMLIQRVHYAVKKELASKKQLEFFWRQTWDEKGYHDIFTHVMPFYSYDVPHTCGPDPSICCQFDFARQRGYESCPWLKNPKTVTSDNVHERATLLLDQYKKKAALYRSNTIIVPLGDDFRYRTADEAEAQYNNYQRIFDYINSNVPGVTAQFGTLSEYFKEVIGTFETPILKGSFFTYSDREKDYWSGYFTSRVFDKALDRRLERVLFAAETMGATTHEMEKPRRALSLFQHHDGVTGTAKTHVVQDYANRIAEAIKEVENWILKRIKSNELDEMQACWKSDSPREMPQNLCGDADDVQVYNPLKYPQRCGDISVNPHETMKVHYPCDKIGDRGISSSRIKFDRNGLMVEPIQEHWSKWKVSKGGAYLFFPGPMYPHDMKEAQIQDGGWMVSTNNWKRTVVQHDYSYEFGRSATVLDFIYETSLTSPNEEWVIQFSSSIKNKGIFHTDLNGFNFDTHTFRDDMPVQSQVFPMPTLASIEDDNMRLTVLSEHAQGTASLLDGEIMVWLDRRLNQDDDRGLGQGVTDNVPIRTRLRVIVESEGYQTQGMEFEITPLCRRMWDELNQPLLAFGKHVYKDAATARNEMKEFSMVGSSGLALTSNRDRLAKGNKMLFDDTTPIIPIVIMTFQRIDYLKKLIQSIRDSDADISRVPIIISQDGDVPEMTAYVDSLHGEFNIKRIVHPYSCYEHPDDFPRDKSGRLNKGFAGDSYGNPRDGKITCCKHHFTWMLKTVFQDLEFDIDVESFLFLEEDYALAPNFYETVIHGLELMKDHKLPDNERFFGLALDPTNGGTENEPNVEEDSFYASTFISNPVVIERSMFANFLKNSRIFCTYDDYNWDWSIVHMQELKKLPRIILSPSKIQAKHIGVEGGMHKMSPHKMKEVKSADFPADFHPRIALETHELEPPRLQKNFGGWSHPRDHEHCMKTLGIL